MGKGYHRLYAVCLTGIEHFVVKGKPFFVRHLLIAFGENPAPGNGHTEYFKAHLGQHTDIFFIAVIKVDAYQFQVFWNRLFRDRSHYPLWHNILDGQAFAVLKVCAFTLVGGYGAAP